MPVAHIIIMDTHNICMAIFARNVLVLGYFKMVTGRFWTNVDKRVLGVFWGGVF